MNDNPRKKGFNYGIGWGPTPKPAIYHEAQQLALALNRVAHAATRKAWSLEMAIRTMRLAETDTERQRAVFALTELTHECQPQLQAAE